MKLDRERMVAAGEAALRLEMQSHGASQRQSAELVLVHKPALLAFAAMVHDALVQARVVEGPAPANGPIGRIAAICGNAITLLDEVSVFSFRPGQVLVSSWDVSGECLRTGCITVASVDRDQAAIYLEDPQGIAAMARGDFLFLHVGPEVA